MTAEARIGRLSLRTHRASGAAARVVTERRLQGLDWHPPGMPPSGILLIRRIEDPLPETFALSGGAPKDWQAALRDRLGALYETALRPWRGGSATAAEALYFSCLADLLAWLAAGLSDSAQSWWREPARRSLADHGLAPPDLSPRTRPAALLSACPEHLPATIAILAREGRLAALATGTDEEESRRILSALSAAFGLPHEVTGDTPAARIILGKITAPDAPKPNSLYEPQPEPVAAPWGPELATIALPAMVPTKVAAALGLALALYRRPLAARSQGFAAQAAAWWRQQDAPASPNPPDNGKGPVPAAQERSYEERTAETDPEAQSANPQPAPERARGDTGPRRRDHPFAPSTKPADPPRTTSEQPPVALSRETGDTTQTARSDAPPAEPRGATAAPTGTTGPSDAPDGPTAMPGERVVTRLGGLMYLIHCLDDLGIPADPALGWPVERAGAWGALRALSRGLLATIGMDSSDDPIWDVFDALEPPLPPCPWTPADLRAPATWPAQLDDADPALRYAAANGRLRLWSPAGYMLADVARDGAPPREQAAREAARFGPATPHRADGTDAPQTPALPTLDPPVAHAARILTPAVLRRLALALGTTAHDAESLRALVGVTATLCLSPSHIDLIARLDQISLPVRRAGLDRDPGWRPDFGRVILFHFH